METAQFPALLIPENPAWEVQHRDFVIRESGELILPHNERAVYRCISISTIDPLDWKITVWLSFAESDPGPNKGIALTLNSPKHDFLINSKWLLWAKGPIFARSNGVEVPLSVLEMSLI